MSTEVVEVVRNDGHFINADEFFRNMEAVTEWNDWCSPSRDGDPIPDPDKSVFVTMSTGRVETVPSLSETSKDATSWTQEGERQWHKIHSSERVGDVDRTKVRLPFGKYKGRPLGKVPEDYAEWLWFHFSDLSKYPELEIAVAATVYSEAREELRRLRSRMAESKPERKSA